MLMPSGLQVYQIKNFIRLNEPGEIDPDNSIKIFRELAAVTTFSTDHNILIDLRKTKVSFTSMEEVMKVTVEFIQYMQPAFKNKIANVIPNDAQRKSLAKEFELCMNLKKINYRFFTDFEEAIEWLADARRLT